MARDSRQTAWWIPATSRLVNSLPAASEQVGGGRVSGGEG
jgi:hypothetical protein